MCFYAKYLNIYTTTKEKNEINVNTKNDSFSLFSFEGIAVVRPVKISVTKQDVIIKSIILATLTPYVSNVECKAG